MGIEMSISDAISGLRDHGINIVREPIRYSFGDKKQCREIFEKLFIASDKTVRQFQFLPEYENIIGWMIDTKGTGLCLVGDCGRGKSIILTGVIPTLFYMRGKIMKPYQAFDIPTKINEIVNYWSLVIDEVGSEIKCSAWGEKYEGFSRIMDNAEAKLKPLFISTNLTKDQIISRYGVRTWERINRLCSVVKFNGESLR